VILPCDDGLVDGIHRFGGHEVDVARYEVRARGERVPVEPQVFDVLAFLIEHRTRVVTKEELLDAVWGDRFVSESALTSRIKDARRAVGDTGREQRVIRTVHGRGYQFVADLDGPSTEGPEPGQDAVHRIPRTRYARSDGLSIAYQIVGDGPEDLLFIPGFVSNVELHWEHPAFVHFFSRLADAGRLITFDKRGTGLSERVAPDRLPTLEERIDDVRAVLDAAGSERAHLFGISEGSAMALLFAALHPDRVRRLVLFGAYGWTPRRSTTNAEMVENARQSWGTGAVFEFLAPSTRGDKATRRFFSRLERHSATPDVAAGFVARSNEIDVTDILGSIPCPTLLIHRTGDGLIPIENPRALAEAIPDAELVELPGEDHLVFIDADPVLDHVVAGLSGPVGPTAPERILTTVLFVDLVDSTATAAAQGDEAWRTTLDRFHQRVATSVADQSGVLVKSLGDGVLARFDGPARAVRAARAVLEAVAPLGLQIRAGVHTAEVEQVGDDLAGIGVHIGARVAAAAEPGEVWTTRTVRDLVAGSGLTFAERGIHQLKGVPDGWALYAAS
jgi:pimeloyl-ACP methyl ester carboxylesterase/DNA-binding winged helix-turn-helix (wHTH) protein